MLPKLVLVISLQYIQIYYKLYTNIQSIQIYCKVYTNILQSWIIIQQCSIYTTKRVEWSKLSWIYKSHICVIRNKVCPTPCEGSGTQQVLNKCHLTSGPCSLCNLWPFTLRGQPQLGRTAQPNSLAAQSSPPPTLCPETCCFPRTALSLPHPPT